MSTLYIRLHSRYAADSTARWLELACPFALVSGAGSIEREGVASLPELSAKVATAQRVVLLLAASDVTLLRVQIPPLPAAKLKAALPNLVEDKLLVDPAECVVVAGGLAGGLRTVAVAQRAWLGFLDSTLGAYGARRIAALPAQLCLPCQPGRVTAAVGKLGNSIELLLRFNEQEGIGLAFAPAPINGDLPAGRQGPMDSGSASQTEGGAQHAAHEAILALCALVPAAPITLYVPQPAAPAYQQAIDRTDALSQRIDVLADNWSRWIAGSQNAQLDLMAGAAGSRGLEWSAWRWPIGLAAAVLLTNAIALNADWWRMKNEASSLRTAMIRTYQSAYPKETVILDPVAQMRQKIDVAKRNAGQPAPDDFAAILAGFGEAWGEAWGGTMPGTSVIEALEYRERSLFVRLKPGKEAPLQQVKNALAKRNLLLDQVSVQPAALWKIRSAK